MAFILLPVVLLFIMYVCLIGYYNKSWRQIPLFTTPDEFITPTVTFSVIIAARNEENNITPLLQSLASQTYPKEFFEVIVVDDHSSDNTAKMVQKFSGVKLIQLKAGIINSYKKKAIETGIHNAKNKWIVCTDADCIAPKDWLLTLCTFIQQYQPQFIAAPVSFLKQRNSILYFFQVLDFLTLQGITGASVYKKIHSMCNGANLAYKKNTFAEVGGFKGVDDIASGDDMLLMHKIWKKYPNKTYYLKSAMAIIETKAADSWNAFFNQRIRWASKAKTYDDKRIFAVLLMVYLFNLSFLVVFIASLISPNYLLILLSMFVMKTVFELPFMYSVSGFFSKRYLLKYFLFFQPLHIAYTIIAGFLGSFGKYEWKGRRVR